MTADALFDFGEPQDRGPGASPSQPLPIRDEQVAQIREGFAAAGISDMDERREFIESCVQRSIGSLRDLRATDVRYVLERLKLRVAAQARSGATGSTWDQRAEDTWIDLL